MRIQENQTAFFFDESTLDRSVFRSRDMNDINYPRRETEEAILCRQFLVPSGTSAKESPRSEAAIPSQESVVSPITIVLNTDYSLAQTLISRCIRDLPVP